MCYNVCMLKENEKILDLERRGLSLIQDTTGYAFTMDAVLLSDFARANAKHSVVELGAGSGVISILLSYKTNAKKIVCVELQDRLADMAARSIALNNLQDRISVHHGDMQTAHLALGSGTFDVAVSNPPYMTYEGDCNQATELDICKREVFVSLQGVTDSASRLLKFGGVFFVVIKGSRLADLMCAMRNSNIEPKRIVAVQPKSNKDIDTILVEGKKGGNPGMVFEKPLVVFNDDNTYTEELRRIYNK